MAMPMVVAKCLVFSHQKTGATRLVKRLMRISPVKKNTYESGRDDLMSTFLLLPYPLSPLDMPAYHPQLYSYTTRVKACGKTQVSATDQV
jgi:hypothetical protein